MMLRRTLLKTALSAALMPLARAFAPLHAKPIEPQEVEVVPVRYMRGVFSFPCAEAVIAGDVLCWDGDPPLLRKIKKGDPPAAIAFNESSNGRVEVVETIWSQG